MPYLNEKASKIGANCSTGSYETAALIPNQAEAFAYSTRNGSADLPRTFLLCKDMRLLNVATARMSEGKSHCPIQLKFKLVHLS